MVLKNVNLVILVKEQIMQGMRYFVMAIGCHVLLIHLSTKTKAIHYSEQYRPLTCCKFNKPQSMFYSTTTNLPLVGILA